ncbi:chemotaxis protein CheB [Nakamurella alba]|nr:chemotaxis protein CheB [Nakamurella alba]
MSPDVPGPARALVAIGGSAGSVGALIKLVERLPAELPAAVLVTVHVGDQGTSRLPEILQRAGSLPCRYAGHGDELRNGEIIVAPPGRHLLVAGSATVLSTGPRVNHVRPAIDPMFGSIAANSRLPAVGVILSGMLDDGAVGAAMLALAGGAILVEDPTTAGFSSMPRAALAAVPTARSAPADLLASAIDELLKSSGSRAVAVSEEEVPVHMGEADDPGFLAPDESGLTRLTCPECHGSLAQVRLPSINFYRCHVGHQYSPQHLLVAQSETAEARLWSAVAALEEQAVLARHLARHLAEDEPTATATARTADQATELAEALRARLALEGAGGGVPVASDELPGPGGPG